MMVRKASSGTQVDQAPEEDATRWDDATGKVKFTDEGEEVPFDAFLARRPGLKFSQYLREFVGGSEHSMRLESISIPRKTRRVVGPSSLSEAKGMPKRSAV